MVVRIKDGSPGSMENGCGEAVHAAAVFSPFMATWKVVESRESGKAEMNAGFFVATVNDRVRKNESKAGRRFIYERRRKTGE